MQLGLEREVSLHFILLAIRQEREDFPSKVFGEG